MATFEDILKRIDKSINKFNSKIPGIQKNVLDNIVEELKRLDLKSGKIKPTVQNIKVLASIRGKLQRLILTDDYVSELKDFVKGFNDITKLQNEYWKSVEKSFTPKTLLKEIKKQAISDTVKKLTESGIGANIEDKLTEILRSNITSGGSYKSLESQLRESLTNTPTSDGSLLKYTKQITTDSINQYNAQYTQIVSSDLGFEWYAYQGSEIETSRPFCQAMVENNRYFHVSQLPNLLKGLDAQGNRLKYKDNKTDSIRSVDIYPRTGLPHGFIEGTNEANFFVRRGGHFCGHQARPVSERLVPEEVKQIVYATAAYKRWKASA